MSTYHTFAKSRQVHANVNVKRLQKLLSHKIEKSLLAINSVVEKIDSKTIFTSNHVVKAALLWWQTEKLIFDLS